MTAADSTVELLQRHLDAEPDDHNARLAVADAITEDGGDGSGFAALARCRRRPWFQSRWSWCDLRSTYWADYDDGDELPGDWFAELRDGVYADRRWLTYPTRLAAEAAAVAAFFRLSTERRQQLLRGEL